MRNLDASMSPDDEHKFSNYFLFVTVISCVGQLSWFAITGFNEIDCDGMSYVGIARHLREGDFHAAINAFRSPLISWIIAAGGLVDKNLLQVGKFVNIASFFASVALLYLLTKRLWHSRLVASVASLWFSLARGFASTAVTLVIPDFLLTVFVLAYFLVLLRCLREDRSGDWGLLGFIHGAAYLTKAFALPWLALATVSSIAISYSKRPGHALNRLVLASLLPLVTVGSWGAVLHSKYEVFTIGSQFKANFVHYNLRSYLKDPPYALLTNAVLGPGVADPSSEKTDEYTVNDPMPPHSPVWNYRLTFKKALPLVMTAELKNLPIVIKELTILLTPGGILGFILMLLTLTRCREQMVAEFRFSLVVAISAMSLIFAYGMLVFITTYAFPLVPLMMAITSKFFMVDSQFAANPAWRRACIALTLAGLAVSFAYSSSPFRTLDRNFQLSCYDAARKLGAYQGSRLVTIGTGPYQEHGVGWEAGYRTAYFANWHVVAETSDLPTDLTALMSDVEKASADAVLLWGKQTDPRYQPILRSLSGEYPTGLPILDPALGRVGEVLISRKTNRAQNGPR
jgi:Dolichyl-phosphate-mannose-protein mannosyltransferase